MINYILIFILSTLIGWFWIWLFNKLQILDKPWPDIIPSRNPVPSIQWIFLILWFILLVFVFYRDYFLHKEFLWLLIWWWIVWLVSVVDLFKSLSPKFRLIVQVLISIISFIFWAWIYSIVMPSGELYVLPISIALIISIIWIIWFINAVNWFDWINSLASWVSTVWFLTIFLLIKVVVLWFYTNVQPQDLFNLNMVANLSFILFSLWAVYTFIEFKPLWVLRDVWVMFYWFSLAYLSLLWWAKIWIMLVVLSLVIFDAVWVVFNRIFVMKKSPLKWDYSHLHYRLLTLKWTRTEVRFFVWWYSLFLMILMILQWVNRFNKLIIFVLMFIIFFWVNYYLFLIKKMPYEYLPWKKKE